eukprot:m.73055 g.73055  ORF g.73055 m.73055 type:complete len:451 (+) comp24516_c0_seq1:200-1552(+)
MVMIKIACPNNLCRKVLQVPTQVYESNHTFACFDCGTVFQSEPPPSVKHAPSQGMSTKSTSSISSVHSFQKMARKAYVMSCIAPTMAVENKIGSEPAGFQAVIAQTLQTAMQRFMDLEDGPVQKIKIDVTVPGYFVPATVKSIMAPHFRKIREANDLSQITYFASLRNAKNAATDFKVIGQEEASGRSPAYFFLTSGQKFILKATDERDYHTLKRILPSYAEHFAKERDSWLPQFFGLYKVKVPGHREQIFIVMNNVFAGRTAIHEKFDLKGSTYKRQASPDELAKRSPVLKDLDWINKGYRLEFDGNMEKELKMLRQDVALLKTLGLIDYSLLVGVHMKVPGQTYDAPERAFIHCLQNDKCLKYIGIVDILTHYRVSKSMEKFYQHDIMGRNASCTAPQPYANRFYDFVKSVSINKSTGVKKSKSINSVTASISVNTTPKLSAVQESDA